MTKRPGAKKIAGERFHLILWDTNNDYAYAYMRENGCRSLAQAVNKIVDEHRKTNTRIAPHCDTSTKLVQ